MKSSSHRFLVVAVLLAAMTTFATADEAKDEAIKKDQKLIEGAWRIVELVIDGNKAAADDARKLTVVNGADGTWSLRSEGNEVSKGTSSINPTNKPKTIDIMATDGAEKGKPNLGIYELGEKTRRLCFAPPGQPRPTEFSSVSGKQQILVTFEREKVK